MLYKQNFQVGSYKPNNPRITY